MQVRDERDSLAHTEITLDRFVTVGYLWHHGWAVLRARWSFRRVARLGRGVRAWNRVQVRGAGAVTIGDGVCFLPGVTPVELIVAPGAGLEIGAQTLLNFGCYIHVSESVVIGARCLIGPDVIIMDNDLHDLDPRRRHERPPSRPVVLEENVWVGARAIILPGVTIGTGSVIGAGSVVTRAIPPQSLAAGMPARVIRSL